MNVRKYSVPVQSACFRKLSDPQNEGHDSYYAYVKVKNLPLNLPLDANPRNQDTGSRVARKIRVGLIEEWPVFHLLNRGITISAQHVDFDNKAELMTIGIPEPTDNYGIIDGGHTYAVIKENLLSPPPDNESKEYENAYVRLEILVNIESTLIVDLAGARNTSAQVKDESLANLEGKFDWIQDTVKKTPFADRIAYRENDDLPIDVREVIALMTLFHPDFAKQENPPIIGYSSKGRCLQMFMDQPQEFRRLQPILVDILRFYDFVHFDFLRLHKEVGGITSVGTENGGTGSDSPEKKKARPGGTKEIKTVKGGFPLFYDGRTANYRFPDGWLYPVVSAHRAIASYKGSNIGWKVDPFKFFERFGKGLVTITLEASKTSGRNPNAVGKSKNHWVQLYGQVQTNFTELLGIDLDRKVSL